MFPIKVEQGALRKREKLLPERFFPFPKNLFTGKSDSPDLLQAIRTARSDRDLHF